MLDGRALWWAAELTGLYTDLCKSVGSDVSVLKAGVAQGGLPLQHVSRTHVAVRVVDMEEYPFGTKNFLVDARHAALGVAGQFKRAALWTPMVTVSVPYRGRQLAEIKVCLLGCQSTIIAGERGELLCLNVLNW